MPCVIADAIDCRTVYEAEAPQVFLHLVADPPVAFLLEAEADPLAVLVLVTADPVVRLT